MPNHSSSSSDSDDDHRQRPHIGKKKPLGRQRPVHQILGGGRVANILLWKDAKISGAVLAGVTLLWFLFEIVEYNLVTFLCHIIITTMLVIFLWCVGADIFRWSPPEIPKIVLQESAAQDLARFIHKRIKLFLSIFFHVASGNNAKVFVMAIVTLWILSIIGSSISTLNLMFLGCLAAQTIPYVYEQYGEEVDDLLSKMGYGMRKSYKEFDSKFLGRIPRGPVKEKKGK
ncbi:reticulon-like protein B9 [Impatiens glandulifera]|uniref:reticulon-like protein B9 n=1 Tax=Impatiens glandulifera TaxID=253017 RepID=UPI001FB0CDDC|nr:reticulon-like protein B9 [Impatiens glandulifera]